MAASGTITKKFHNDGYSLVLSWTESNVDTTNNCSDITVTAKLVSNATGYYINSTASKNISLTINGTTYSSTCTVGISSNGTKTLMTKTVSDIPHSSDGSKSVSVSCTLGIAVTLSGKYYSSVSASGTAKLTTIARKSTMTVANGTLGTAQTLSVTRGSSSFTHTITAVCGEASTTICTKSSTTSISFAPPLEWARQRTSGTAVTIKYTITTYNGSTSLGSNEYTKTCDIPASVVPTASITLSDAMGYSSTYGGYIQGKSKFAITVSALGNLGSTIKSYKVTANGNTYTTANVTTDVIASSGTQTISVTVTDSRGRTATATKSVSVLAYSNPKITAMNVKRCNSNGTSNSAGAYISVTFSASVTSLSSKNTASYVLKYKTKTATTYTSVTLSQYANNYTVTNGSYIFAASSGSSYDVVLTITDKFGSIDSTQTGKSSSKTFSLYEGGLGVAFGKIAERANALEVGFDLYDKNDTQIRNGLCAYESAGIDANTTLEHCFLTNVNTPTTNQFWYVQQYFYASKTETSNRMQVAFPYKAAGISYHRYYLNGAWCEWQNGCLPLTGGTMSGSVIFGENIVLNNNTWLQAKKTDGENRNMLEITASGEYMFGYGGYQHSEGYTYYDGNNVIVRSRSSITLRNVTGDLVYTTDRFRTNKNDTFYLGDATYKWKAVYAVNGTIQTSDRNQKENINGIEEKYEELFGRLQPVTFELKGGEHDRVHIGFIAQDVKEAMDEVGLTNEELAAYCVDTKKVFDEETEQDVEVLDENGKPVEVYSLRYTEFIALNTHMIQKQQAEIDLLKQEIAELKNMVRSALS